jgi:ATP-binding protein involved in chromosome partitioning
VDDRIVSIVSETAAPLIAEAGARLGGIMGDDSRLFVTVEVDPQKGAALEDFRQRLTATLSPLAGGREVMVVLTSERAPPPDIKTRAASKPPAFSHKISSKPVAPGVRHMIAVASGKGGVGKSTAAANIALALSAMGKKTGLLDADIYGASQPVMMGLRTRPETDASDMIVPPVAHGIKVMSMGFFVDPQAPVIWRGPMVHSAIQQLLRDVAWGDLDVLVIDLPPGTGDAQLSLAQYVPLSGAVIVSTPQDVALNEAMKGLRMFEKTNVPVLGIIENMSHFNCPSCGHAEHIFGDGGAKRAASENGITFLGAIPVYTDIRQAADGGVPVVAAKPDHPAAEIFRNIAARVWMQLPEKKIEKQA